MDKKETIGKWSDSLNAFWFGANDCEWVAWKGSYQIFVYPCNEHPNPPASVIQHTNRIETIEDFTEAMENGRTFQADYMEKKIGERTDSNKH
jgi:hypothetical protein